MPRQVALLLLAGLLSACNPRAEPITLGQPATRLLKTTELTTDAEKRLWALALQTDLSNNALFAGYRRRAPSQWNQGWPRRIDFSGVSWSHRQAGTAITPRHIVLAAHYQLKVGASITFHERSGKVHTRKIAQKISFRGQKVPAHKRSDIAVALLDSPLPPTIKTYRLLPPREDYGHTLVGAPVLVTEQKRRIFIHQIRRCSGRSIAFQKHPDFPESLYKNLIKGDSGHPSFILVGGEPVLIETHTGGGGGSGPFYSDPTLFEAVRGAVAELDASYQIQTVPLNPTLAPAPPQKVKVQPTRPSPPPGKSPPPPAPNDPRQPRVRRVPPPSKPTP